MCEAEDGVDEGEGRLCLGAATFAINAPLYFVYTAHGEGTDESARVDIDCELPKMLATRRSSNDKSPPTHPHTHLLSPYTPPAQ